MSNFPLKPDYFIGGQRVAPIDESEGGPPLALLINEVAQTSSSTEVLTGDVDYSAVPAPPLTTAGVVQAANRRTITNAGSARAVTLPDFDEAPNGWTQTYIALDAAGLTVVAAGADTINGVNGTLTLALAHDWATVTKVSGAPGWLATSAGGAGSTLIPA